MDYIISSHGKKEKKNGTFKVPKGITLKFYCNDGQSVSMEKGYAIFGLIYNNQVESCQPTEIVHGGTEIPNYTIYNGHFRPLKEGRQQDVNGVFEVSGYAQLTCLNDLKEAKSLSDVVNLIIESGPCENKVIHCLFCR